MKQEIDKISYREYLFLVFNHIIGYTLVLSFTDSVAKQDSWLVILSGFLTAIPFVLLYAVLAKRFPSKTLLEVYRLVFGKWIGTAVSFLYVLLFLVVLGFYLRDLEEFYTGFIQPETPPVLFVVVALTAAAYGIMTGIEFLAKMSFPFAVLSILSIVVTFVFLIGKMDFSNFLPVLRQPPKTYLSSISQFALVPCGQMMFLLMLTPKLRSARRLPRYSLLGLALGVSGFLLISIRNTAVLGPMASLVNSASYDATSLIDIGDIFTRVDFIVALNTTISLFFNICILYYAAAAGAAQFFKLKSMRWAILPVGAVSAVLALKLFNSSMEHLEFSVKYNVLLFSPFHFLIPSVALLTATLRRLREPEPGG